ncbi:hypothetical protein ACE6H2_005466 [Prunus campanulata]
MDARKAHKASSSSPSSSSKRWEYQVFLSFRGEDTRKGFTGHLHAALSDAGIRAFLDDNELKRAEFLKTQLEQAIDGSMISIIVFSKSYADSSWCLDELVKIMECREKLGQQVIPLFYNVDASDVRKQTGSFAQAFEKHEAGICEGKHEKEKVQRWRNALTRAADLCGEDLKNAAGNEVEFIKKILRVVNNLVNRNYQLDIEHLVGITSRVKVLSNHLDIENSGSKDVVRMIGILGMGGIGKTTLAKTIYNKFEHIFEGRRSFLENVREVFANQRSNGLAGLQEQLLNDILNSKDPIKVDSVAKGIDMIRERLCCKRALVIIDDADDLEQVEAIARARDWFGLGSRIVITTRNKHLLEQVGVDSTYMAQEMDEEEALELFSCHAFKRGYPDQEYLDLSKRVIHYCQGLPLALRVVGSFLIKRSIADWENHLEKLKRCPDGKIHKTLRISFDGLPDDTTRNIFLDISCFFIGENKDYVTRILDGCGFFAKIGISVLIERCLVTVSEQNELMMHDLLRDMGREIVHKNARGHPEKFSRLWKREDVTDVLNDESGTDEIEGVALYIPWYDKDSLHRFRAQAFTNMKKLRLLRLSNVELTGEYKDFPKKLMWLSWDGFPLESIPDDFPMQPNLVGLELQFSKLKIVWKDCKLHRNLKILNLTWSNKLTKSPDFSKLPNLEELILEYCESLSEVHSSIGDLGRLSLVNLQYCENLRAIPDLPTNLEVLRADGCFALEKMPDFSEMSNIRELYLSDLGKLTEIPGLDKSLNSMTIIHMGNCTNLTADFRKNILQGWTSCGYGGIFLSGNDIPDWFDYVQDDDIVYFTVPQSVVHILKGLTLSFVCSSYARYGSHISISIKNMTEGTELDARIIPYSTNMWPTRGYYLWQGQLSNDELKLQDGDKVLIEIIVEEDDLVEVKKTGVSLVWDKFMNENMIDYHLCAYERRPYLVNDDDIIHVEYDNRITKSPDFSKFPNLEKLILKGCVNLYKVHSFIGDLGRLSLVNLEGCSRLRDLPLNFYKSKSIETLILNGCSRFENLADGLGDMVSLTILEADDTDNRQIPSSIVKLKKLRILSLSGCWLTEDAIPKDLCGLISLEDLLLGDNEFRSLPSLAGLSKLKVLSLNACNKLRAIPDLPTNLYVLKANGCPKLETIPDFSKMSNMRELYLSDSFKLTEVPGLDKSLNSMTRIHMEGCTNLTADFRNNILQRWTSCGFGGIYLNGIYDIPEWFKIVNDVGGIFFFEVPQKIMGRDLKGLTICFVYSYFVFGPKLEDSEDPIGIIVRNLTKQTALHAKIAFARYIRPEHVLFLSNEPENDYLWQGQLSNDVLRLQGGDQVSILVRPLVDFVIVKKTGVHLEWDKVMKENMDNPDPHLYDLETNRDFSGGVDDAFFRGSVIHEQLAVEPYLDFFGGTDNEAGP